MDLKKYAWELRLSLILIALSAVIFAVKLLLLGDSGESNTFSYIFNALGFLPLNVLFVTLLLNTLLSRRAKKAQQEKMKMVVGLFFSELGTTLLRMFVHSDSDASRLSSILSVDKSWSPKEYQQAQNELSSYHGKLSMNGDGLQEICVLLNEKHDFLLRLVENPVFLEGERTADLMQAVFHLSEELSDRSDFASLPKADIAHLNGDVRRVYLWLLKVWLSHMEYLSQKYPYLLSLSLRKSPFDEHWDVVVRE